MFVYRVHLSLCCELSYSCMFILSHVVENSFVNFKTLRKKIMPRLGYYLPFTYGIRLYLIYNVVLLYVLAIMSRNSFLCSVECIGRKREISWLLGLNATQKAERYVLPWRLDSIYSQSFVFQCIFKCRTLSDRR